MKWHRRGFWVCALLLAAIVPPQAHANDLPYEKNLYVWDGEDGRILFVASPSQLEQALLQSGSGSTDEALISEEQLSVFARALNRAKEGQRTFCTASPAQDSYSHPYPGMPVVPESRPQITAVDMIRGQPTAIVGSVKGTMVSATFEGLVTTLIFVQVSEVLNDNSGTISFGDLVTFEQPWGEFEIRQSRLCTAAPEGVLQIEEGDMVIVSGSMFYWNEKHIETTDSGYFRVDDGLIVYSPRRKEFSNEEALDISTLRRELEGS